MTTPKQTWQERLSELLDIERLQGVKAVCFEQGFEAGHADALKSAQVLVIAIEQHHLACREVWQDAHNDLCEDLCLALESFRKET